MPFVLRQHNHSLRSYFTDAREFTRETRRRIGFPSKEAWRNAPAIYTDHALSIEGHPVMEDWEDGYMHMLADVAASGGGTVLEVGFGMGLSARYIEKHALTSHLIIEANRGVFEELTNFAKDYPRVRPLFGFWEEVTASLPSGSIDGILFDTYPLSEEELHENHFPFFREARRLLSPKGVLTYYSDEATDFSPRHRHALATAGFTRVAKLVCPVEPPPDCIYWREKTLLVPIVRT